MNPLSKKLVAALLAFQVTSGTAALADGIEQWNQDRARLFSRVCMKSAPSFAEFGALAQNEGFIKIEDQLVYQPEVVVSLQERKGHCYCYMTVGAPDQTAMVTAMFSQLMQDFGDDFRGELAGSVNVTPFDRDGVGVTAVLSPEIFQNQPWISARVQVRGVCPTNKEGI